ncbi:hypothetical protein HZ326_1400 [Fusarium oxysporum f. sp. albedinis]|nr:hypothetical protein HZ326_1400 [Fusarium oxysporum f. sp. albedinis]
MRCWRTTPALSCNANAMYCKTKAPGFLWRNKSVIFHLFPISTNLASVFGSGHHPPVHLAFMASNRSM